MPNPSAPPSPPAAGRYCDLVLQGGVVSGVVYPRAIAKLATRYGFHSLGGTSVGALAAAVTAAAEYGRRRARAAMQAGQAPAGVTGQEGFVALDGLAERLAETVGGGTRLRSLFQPRAGLDALMALFVRGTAIGLKHRGRARLLRLAALAVSLHAPWALAGALLVALVLAPAWTTATAQPLAALAWGLGALALLLVGALIGTLVAIVLAVLGPLVANHFGLCKLGDEGPSSEHTPGLTRWLHQHIQRLAGRPDGTPLTFRDLATAPGGPPGAAESIRLKLVTTNLTLARPFVLPLTVDEERLFFRPEELASYFPPDVIESLGRKPYEPKQLDGGDPPAGERTTGYFELPRDDLPIVVAARLSLSFPLLISAVPLYAIDREPPAFEARRLERCWFSDGGICANFPIHFFDSAVPRWPTFGISLGARSAYRPGQKVWLPQQHWRGRGDGWEGRDDPRAPAADRLLAFLGRILTSAKDWNDRTLMRMPGVRDRVVRVGFLGDESELDIGLAGAHIVRMADDYGPDAGAELLARFVDASAADGLGRGWHEHRWVRLQTLLVGLQDLLHDFESRAVSAKLAELTAQAFERGVLEGSKPMEKALSAKQANAIDALRVAVTGLASALAERPMDAQPYQPQPRPSLRPRPPL